MTQREHGPVRESTEKAIEAAKHLTEMDQGAVEALRVLAGRIDALLDPDDESGEGGKFDNVTIPTYLKYCESLGLTPAGRRVLGEKKKETRGGKLGQLRSVPRPKSA